MSIKDITIVITSFKSEKKIKKCLNSIDKECKVINIENSNNLNYREDIEKEFNNVKCILSGENIGYGRANNIGLKEVKTKYALILNPDTELFTNTLKNFLIAAKENPDAAIIGPNIREDKKEENFTSTEEIKKLTLLKTDVVKGYAMFLNLSHFEEVGFFDEKFFIYLEEIDLCRRVLKKNKKIYWSPNILIYHEGGRSHESSIDDEIELSRNWRWMWSSFYYNKKYRGFIISFFFILPKLLSAIFKVVIYSDFVNRKKKAIYSQRVSGLINSMIGKESWYRPKI